MLRVDPTRRWEMPAAPALVAMAVVVFATAWTGIEFTRHVTRVAAIWPANAILLVALLRTRSAGWPAFVAVGYAANAAANLSTGDAPTVALALSACNTIEVLFCAVPLRDRLGPRLDLTRRPELLAFGLAATLAPAVAATGAAALLSVLHQGTVFFEVWRTWWLADVLGLLVLVPPLLAIRADEAAALLRPPGAALRGGALLLLVAAVTLAVFAQDRYPLLFAVFPALVLATLALGCTGAALATLVIAALATGLTVAGTGPLTLVDGASASERVLLLQVFLAAAVLVAVPVATALAERQRLARSIISTQQRLDDALAGMADGFALFDADERLVLCNQRYRDLFPASAHLCVPGVRLLDLVREAARQGELEGVGPGNVDAWAARARARFYRRSEPQEVAFADGRWVEIVSRPTAGGDRIFVCRDLTGRKRLEQDLEARNRRLEATNAALDQFASMAAHDLRAPLRQVGVLCEWLTEELGEGCSEAAKDHLEQVRRRVRRMGGLVEGLRQYAYAGANDPPASDVALGPLAAEAAELADPPAGFRVEVAPNLPTVNAPEAALALILRNLVGNAVKHHDRPDGRVRVRAIRRPGEIEFVVEDDGPGIPESQRERVFDLFAQFRGDAAEPGGVGLALVRRTATVHGGRAWIAPSSFGRGLAVHVAWPRPRPRAAVAA